MFAVFLDIVFKSLKLDRSLYSDNKYFGEAAIYFAGLIMILEGVAGAIAANSIIKTSIGLSGLTAILTWFIWSILIFVIGVKLFPDKNSKIPFKKVLIGVGYARTWINQIFCSHTRFSFTCNIFNSILDFCVSYNINQTCFGT